MGGCDNPFGYDAADRIIVVCSGILNWLGDKGSADEADRRPSQRFAVRARGGGSCAP
jgi:hypothetical protein